MPGCIAVAAMGFGQNTGLFFDRLDVNTPLFPALFANDVSV